MKKLRSHSLIAGIRGYNYRDPDLSNGGAGYGPYAKQKWDNRVSYIVFLKGGKLCS